MLNHKIRFYSSHLIIFSSMALCLLGISLWQNKIYYDRLEYENQKNHKNYISVLSTYLLDCKNNSIDNNVCEKRLSNFINKTFQSGILTLTYNRNSYVFDHEKHKDNRKPIITTKTISSNPTVIVSISKLTTQPIKTSLWNSITFSYSDWKLNTNSFNDFINQFTSQDFRNFILYVVIPRSMFLWVSFIIFSITYFIIVKRFNVAIRKIIQTEEVLFESESEKLFLNKQKNYLLQQKQELESEILSSKQKEAQYNKEIATLTRQAEKTKIKIKSFKAENSILLQKVRESKAELEELETLQKAKEERIKELNLEITSQKNVNYEKAIELERLKNEVKDIQTSKEKLFIENNNLQIELTKGHEQIEKLQSNYSVVMDDLKVHQELIQNVDNENKILSQKLNQTQVEKEKIDKIYQNTQNEINEYKQLKFSSTYHVNNDQFQKGKFKEKIKLLLKNPDLEKKKNQKIKLNQGKHHSKDTISFVKDKLENKLSDLGIIESITPTNYSPKQRSTMVLQNQINKQYNENRYILNIYYDNDAGHGIEVLLTADNAWEAVLQAKLIRELNEFSHYQLKVTLK